MNSILLVAHAPLAHALRQCALHVFPEAEAAIVALDRLAARERALTANLVELRTLLLQNRLLQAAAS